MARVYREGDIGNEIQAKKVAVLGFGSQGHAHALNLHESGVEVAVGLYEGSSSKQKAEAEGLEVMSVSDATKWADVVMFTIPDERQPTVYEEEVKPNLSDGMLVLFAHGFKR